MIYGIIGKKHIIIIPTLVTILALENLLIANNTKEPICNTTNAISIIVVNSGIPVNTPFSNKNISISINKAITKTFKITGKSLTKASVSGISNKVYTGKAIKPAPVVKLGGKTLKKGTDYTVSYKNNKKVGKAAVTVKGKNSYEGSVSKTFIIRPGQNKIVKLTSPKTKQLKVKWKKDPRVTGYEVRVALNKTFSKGLKKVTIKKNTTVAKTFKGLKKGKAYYARIRAYKSIDGKAYYGKFSPVKKLKIK